LSLAASLIRLALATASTQLRRELSSYDLSAWVVRVDEVCRAKKGLRPNSLKSLIVFSTNQTSRS
jgi:hypothetical protein